VGTFLETQCIFMTHKRHKMSQSADEKTLIY